MKKTIVCIIIFLMAMSLCSCAMQAQTPAEQPTSATETDVSDTDDKKPTDLQSAVAEKDAPDTESQSTSVEAQCFDLMGPWHLDQEKTDISAIEADMETFPGYAEWGAGMEIRSNGQISWYIGAVGGSGTYTIEDDVLHAELTDSMEQNELTMDFQIVGKDAIKMTYANTEIIWAYGDQEDIPANGD